MIAETNNLFGFAIVSANARASAIGLSSSREKLCLAFSVAFGHGESKSFYQQIKNSDIGSIGGFGAGSQYKTREQEIYNILDTNYPSETIANKKFLALSVNALIFSYYVYSDMNISDVVGLMGELLFNTCAYITQNQLFSRDSKGIVGHPITSQVIQSSLGGGYSETIQSLSSSQKKSNINVVNYNWMNVEDIFAQPNLSLMKDIENQYYYLSGNLSYKSSVPDIGNCLSVPVTINTPTGQVTFSYYLQEPCIEENSYIGPITGISFNRIFNDGPYTSGDFNGDVESAYIQFDKNILSPNKYGSNSRILYSFLTGSDSGYLPISFSPTFIDANGQYDLPQEYADAPESYSCSSAYSGNMHIGNNEPKIKCDRDEHNNCVNCRFVPNTGFKFASLELNKDVWGDHFAYIKTNPVSSVDNILKRALNILPYSYLSVLGEDSFSTMGEWNTRYLGYPQLTGQNALPNIAFFQDFDSSTFNKSASICMYPSIGTSYNGTGEDSDRQYQISPLNIFSGASVIHTPVGQSGYSLIKFTKSIPSSGLVDDTIAQQFFGMGNNFNNQLNTVTVSESNAGFLYSGVYVDNSGVYSNIINSNIQFENATLGSPVDSINFIKGYSSEGNQYLVKKIYAQDNSGNLIPYYNLLNSDLPDSLQIDENQTQTLTPLPYVLESELYLSHVNDSQIVENYFPRFASGAFATTEQKFLYPNAKQSSQLYNSKTNGFPLRINFTLNIREETVRELYAKYSISNNGLISSSPNYVNVIRPNQYGSIDLTNIEPVMNQIFVPNNSFYSKKYDFNNFAMDADFAYTAPLNMVDNNWSPFIYRNFYTGIGGKLLKDFVQRNTQYAQYDTRIFSTPSGKNSLFTEDTWDAPFLQGVRLTGNGPLFHQWFTGTGNNDTKFIADEAPLLNGLYHYYQPLQITGYLLYTPPYFDLSSGAGYINEAIKEAFSLMIGNNYNIGPINCHSWYGPDCATPNGSYTQSISGVTGYLSEGIDPLFLEYMGGRSGGLNVLEEGSYHSKGLIGDIWNNFSYQAYGMLGWEYWRPCSNATRWPANDSKIVLLSSTQEEMKIFTRALSFNPFRINQYQFQPFGIFESYPYSIGGISSSFDLSVSGDFGQVDLINFMPLENPTSDGLYDPTGLVIGPFDRDVELGVLSGNMIYATNANLFCNGNQITDVSGVGGCDANAQYYDRYGLDSGIIPGGPGRSVNFTIFAVIGNGQTATLNLSGVDSGSQFGFQYLKTSGSSGESLNNTILTIRPRKIIGASKYDTNIHYGEESWTSPFSFLNNGLEKQYNISTSNFEDLANKTLSITTYSQSGKLYPIPGPDFTGLAIVDTNGNFKYPPSATVENYWKTYAARNKTRVTVSGWREGSRLSFQFTDISVQYDSVPYQTQKIIIPSGECIVSGEMGYLQQADASVYTAGVILEDKTAYPDNELTSLTPSFYSDVLNRLPWMTGISGEYPNPILKCPSVMIQRKNVGIISGDQQYNKLNNFPPYNYNKLNWSAVSDLEFLNEGESLEAALPNDPTTFNQSQVLFSASQGQNLANGKKNPVINQTYDIVKAYQTYDSIAADALVNSGICLTSNYGAQNRLQQSLDLSGVIAPIGATISLIKAGVV
jgi:hypothetical protein